MRVEDCERWKYSLAFSYPEYRKKCHGLTLWQDQRSLFPRKIASAIDLGCGTGRLVQAWRSEGIDGYGVDLLPAAYVDPDIYEAYPDVWYVSTLWDFRPRLVFDCGVCADVMEHIPEDRVSDVLRVVARCCRWAIFKIANFPSQLKGMVLHLTRRDRAWWRHAIHASMRGTVHEPPYETAREEYLFVWQQRA